MSLGAIPVFERLATRALSSSDSFRCIGWADICWLGSWLCEQNCLLRCRTVQVLRSRDFFGKYREWAPGSTSSRLPLPLLRCIRRLGATITRICNRPLTGLFFRGFSSSKRVTLVTAHALIALKRASRDRWGERHDHGFQPPPSFHSRPPAGKGRFIERLKDLG